MNGFTKTARLLATLVYLGLPTGCAGTGATNGTAVHVGAAVMAGDIDRLTGAPWTGTLTYLDYERQVPTTIKSSLQVARLPDPAGGAAAWDMRVGYADEPHANSGETLVLPRGGRTFRDGQVVERAIRADGTVRVVTEQDGLDDNRAARFRFVYLLGQRECSIQKLVRFTPREEFFERHIYRWSR